MNIINLIISLFKGFFTVGANIFKMPVTLKYPEVKKNHIKLRGKINFSYKEDGSIKCIACGLCQKVCPAFGTISITKSLDNSGKAHLQDFTMNLDSCIFCGNCVENCPTKAIVMSKEYELASPNKQTFKIQMRCHDGNIE